MPAQHAKSIALTPQLAEWVDELVRSGQYASASEVMREGLRALRDRMNRESAELADIQDRVRRSFDQADRGDFVEGTGEQAVERAFDKGLKRAGV